MKAKKIVVTGLVQGVGFRFFTQKKAKELDILVSVQNLDDGSVLIYAEANEALLQNFVEWCSHGPASSKVSNCEISLVDLVGYSDFKIIR